MLRIPTLYSDLAASMDALRAGHEALDRSREIVIRALEDGQAHYGINTGFGVLATRSIDNSRLAELQQNILLSHACGVGEPVPAEITRLMLQLKIHALGLGQSGISRSTFEQLLAFERLGLTSWVPSRGSVGASGDLAPLAHLCLPLIGRGEVWNETETGKKDAAEAMRLLGIEPVRLKAKDGLALINGTQLMAAYGAFVLERALVLQREADILAAMSLEALQGSAAPFDPRIHRIRPHPGQENVAANIRKLLEKSEIMDSHRDCGRVQDPYCLRCVPQVHGASRDALAYATGVVEIEINSVTDNPLVFDNGDIISGGNFHGQPLALALDVAAIALAELASISERRTYLLLGGHDGLPELLMKDTGINSGFMQHGFDQRAQAVLGAAQRRARVGSGVPDRRPGAGLPRAAQAGARRVAGPPIPARSDKPRGPGLRGAQRPRYLRGHPAPRRTRKPGRGPDRPARLMPVLRNISQLATCPPGNPQHDAGLIEHAALATATCRRSSALNRSSIARVGWLSPAWWIAIPTSVSPVGAATNSKPGSRARPTRRSPQPGAASSAQ
jgi:histidine ammonia-lyase